MLTRLSSSKSNFQQQSNSSFHQGFSSRFKSDQIKLFFCRNKRRICRRINKTFNKTTSKTIFRL